jgi:hypothetical protein
MPFGAALHSIVIVPFGAIASTRDFGDLCHLKHVLSLIGRSRFRTITSSQLCRISYGTRRRSYVAAPLLCSVNTR